MINIILFIGSLLTFSVLGYIIYRKNATKSKERRREKEEEKREATISIRESLALTRLPIISFTHKGYGTLNMLVDTGSNVNLLDSKVFGGVIPEDMKPNVLNSINGVQSSFGRGDLTLYYKDKEYLDTFSLLNKNAFIDIKEEYGVTVHGILGTPFFEKYNYIIDFKEYIIKSN